MLKEQRTEPLVFLSSLCVCSLATNSWAPMSGSLKITVLINMLCNYCEADRAERRRERERETEQWGQGLGQISLKSKLMSCGLQKKNLILILQWLLKACSCASHIETSRQPVTASQLSCFNSSQDNILYILATINHEIPIWDKATLLFMLEVSVLNKPLTLNIRAENHSSFCN